MEDKAVPVKGNILGSELKKILSQLNFNAV
jgi:hypothetical protein